MKFFILFINIIYICLSPKSFVYNKVAESGNKVKPGKSTGLVIISILAMVKVVN